MGEAAGQSQPMQTGYFASESFRNCHCPEPVTQASHERTRFKATVRGGGKPFGKGRPGGPATCLARPRGGQRRPGYPLWLAHRDLGAAEPAAPHPQTLPHRECRAAPRRGEHRDARDAGDGAPEPDRRASRTRCRASGPARGGRSPALARHRDARARRHGAGARPDHRSAQCRRDPALGGGVCGEGDRHHRAALAGGDRRAGEIGLRRTRAGAAGDACRIWRAR